MLEMLDKGHGEKLRRRRRGTREHINKEVHTPHKDHFKSASLQTNRFRDQVLDERFPLHIIRLVPSIDLC